MWEVSSCFVNVLLMGTGWFILHVVTILAVVRYYRPKQMVANVSKSRVSRPSLATCIIFAVISVVITFSGFYVVKHTKIVPCGGRYEASIVDSLQGSQLCLK